MKCHCVTSRIDHELQSFVRDRCGASILIVPRIPRVTGKNVSCETKKFTEPVREVKIPTGNPNGLRAIFFFVSVLIVSNSFFVLLSLAWLCLFKGLFCRCLSPPLLPRPSFDDNALITSDLILSLPLPGNYSYRAVITLLLTFLPKTARARPRLPLPSLFHIPTGSELKRI